MSVTVHNAGGPAGRSSHQRLVIAAAVIATLTVIAGPGIAATFGGVGRWGPDDRHPTLTTAAQRVLEEAPGAFETGGIVVVPASTNRDILWTGAISTELVMGPVIDLGVRGLAQPGYLPTGTAPGWLANVGTGDQVYDEVGSLSFACTRWPGADSCKGTLLIEHTDERYIFRSGLDLAQSPAAVSTFLVLAEGRPRELVVGSAPPDASRVLVTLADGVRTVEARTSAAGAVDGGTLWWVVAADPVSAVTFVGADGAVLAQSSQ